MDKHTPGPLFVQQPEKWPFRIEIVDADGNLIHQEDRFAHSTKDQTIGDVLSCRHFRPGVERGHAIAANERQLADAYLRAAAPDLLDAAKQMVEATGIFNMIDYPEPIHEALDALEVAIAKATGGQS